MLSVLALLTFVAGSFTLFLLALGNVHPNAQFLPQTYIMVKYVAGRIRSHLIGSVDIKQVICVCL